MRHPTPPARRLDCWLVTAALALGVGCGSGLRVTGLQLGRGINPDETVSGHTTVFKPTDTIYISIQTAGVGAGTLSVRWTYGGRVVDEPSKKVHYRDVAATEFHLQSVGGFPPGEYNVEAFLDGQPAGSRRFRVDPVAAPLRGSAGR